MFYFAYGSNMSVGHMRRLCQWRCRVLGMADLSGYEFGFGSRGYGNIRPSQNSKVNGVLYDIDEKCLGALDNFEGYPKVFGREKVEVSDIDGNKYQAWVYLEPPKEFGGKPKLEYLQRVIDGARENNLPKAWLEKLESFLE